jgi:hypothetical protein
MEAHRPVADIPNIQALICHLNLWKLLTAHLWRLTSLGRELTMDTPKTASPLRLVPLFIP